MAMKSDGAAGYHPDIDDEYEHRFAEHEHAEESESGDLGWAL
ncbi:hypothetical protein [Rhodopirellula sp. UBA1907]|nr:hypothetical protein [Rhodopirellula sp. UBA1907]